MSNGEFESGIGKRGIAVAVALLLAGCATPTVVQTVQPNDGQLNCEDLQKALTEAGNSAPTLKPGGARRAGMS